MMFLMADPFIIMSAPNGARRQKSDHPALPITPQDLAACAEEVADAGASILHLHVRDDQGRHSLDVDRYRAAIAAIHDAVAERLIIQVTSEAVGQYSRAEQMQMVRHLKPGAVSLALRELCPTDEYLGQMADFIAWMKAEHVLPQYILYNQGDYARFENYRRKGLFLNDSPFVLFVLGRHHEKSEKPSRNTENFRDNICTAVFPWSVCGFQINEFQAIPYAARHGGHIRVGFENNIWQKNKDLLSGHPQMIELCKEAAKQVERSIATADDAMDILNVR
ncbi:MAG: class III aminotransferase [Robiginitomaculum sp.]|nr:MAG: class III aminotransferase [Robiginitomaculum sp.]